MDPERLDDVHEKKVRFNTADFKWVKEKIALETPSIETKRYRDEKNTDVCWGGCGEEQLVSTHWEGSQIESVPSQGSFEYYSCQKEGAMCRSV